MEQGLYTLRQVCRMMPKLLSGRQQVRPTALNLSEYVVSI
jgi:hypothetical protein